MWGSCFRATFMKTTEVLSLSDEVMTTLDSGSNITLLIGSWWMLGMWRWETMLLCSARSYCHDKMRTAWVFSNQQLLVITVTLFTTRVGTTHLLQEIELCNSIDETRLTGKKILCGPFSCLDEFLKRPLAGFKNHMRWTPPFSSPSSNREGWSGHWEGGAT